MEQCIYHEALAKKVNEIHSDMQDVKTVKVINGKEKEMPINKAIAEIWEATQFARDRHKVFKIASRYERTKYIVKRLIVIGATLIILLHYFKFQFQDVIKFLLNLN